MTLIFSLAQQLGECYLLRWRMLEEGPSTAGPSSKVWEVVKGKFWDDYVTSDLIKGNSVAMISAFFSAL